MTIRHSPRTSFLAAALVAVLAVVLPVALPTALTPAAEAAARVNVTNDRGTSAADTTYQTKLTIAGSGFQVVKGGFGGVYVMFGWVKGNGWQPSKGGVTGADYRYIPDAESGDNAGYLRFVAFPGSSTANEAHATLSGNGGFTVELNVPGPTFQSVDRTGKVSTVDCRKVTCGVITIGAHGVKNARNETFTPVKFTTVYDTSPAAGPASQAPGAATPETATTDTPVPGETDEPDAEVETPPGEQDASATPAAEPSVTTDRATAVQGHALAFTGGGFHPGEQVLAILDDGVAALGPMVAGANGEIAGLLQLSPEVGPGTHELRLVGAASGTAVAENFPVRAAAAGAEPVAADSGPGWSLFFLLMATALFVLSAGFLVLRLVRTRRRPVPAGGA